MQWAKDIWRPAIVAAPLASIIARGSLEGLPFCWLPAMDSFQFMADPFGLWRNGHLHVFVETYDYRVRVGRIDVLIHDANLTLVDRLPALAESWHLSYPFVFEAEDETWMLPEAHKSRGLTLYRASHFPDRWEPAGRIELGAVPIDATPLFHDGIWWLFYTPDARRIDRTSALHLAWAETLTGPWHPMHDNPVHFDVASARPGGTPIVIEGRVMLPVQDCTRTYGGAIRPLWFDVLTPDRVECRPGPPLVPVRSFEPFTAGMHTLSAAGAVTLVDVKRLEMSLRGIGLEMRHQAAKARRRLARLS